MKIVLDEVTSGEMRWMLAQRQILMYISALEDIFEVDVRSTLKHDESISEETYAHLDKLRSKYFDIHAELSIDVELFEDDNE